MTQQEMKDKLAEWGIILNEGEEVDEEFFNHLKESMGK